MYPHRESSSVEIAAYPQLSRNPTRLIFSLSSEILARKAGAVGLRGRSFITHKLNGSA